MSKNIAGVDGQEGFELLRGIGASGENYECRINKRVSRSASTWLPNVLVFSSTLLPLPLWELRSSDSLDEKEFQVLSRSWRWFGSLNMTTRLHNFGPNWDEAIMAIKGSPERLEACDLRRYVCACLNTLTFLNWWMCICYLASFIVTSRYNPSALAPNASQHHPSPENVVWQLKVKDLQYWFSLKEAIKVSCW